MKEPFYHLDYTSGSCLFKLYINEILIVDNLQEQKSLAGNVLLNQFIYDEGIQIVRFELFPQEGNEILNENSFIEIYLYVSDQTTGFSNTIDILSRGTKLPHNLLYNEGKLLNTSTWIIDFEAKVPYSLEKKWNEAKEFNLDQNKIEEIKGVYTEIYQLAQEGNAVELYEILEDSFHRTSITMYEKERNNVVQVFENLIKKKPIGDSIYKLEKLEFGNVRIYGNGKVVDVLRPDGKPILLFKKKEEDENGATLEVRLYQSKEDSKYKII
ncbi:hypothetical protein [Empedobacter tilapiae]